VPVNWAFPAAQGEPESFLAVQGFGFFSGEYLAQRSRSSPRQITSRIKLTHTAFTNALRGTAGKLSNSSCSGCPLTTSAGGVT
jgi:hypothetical protein